MCFSSYLAHIHTHNHHKVAVFASVDLSVCLFLYYELNVNKECNIHFVQVFRSLEILLHCEQTISSLLPFLLPLPESRVSNAIGCGLLISTECWKAEVEQKQVL